jgi:hypothetical protein
LNGSSEFRKSGLDLPPDACASLVGVYGESMTMSNFPGIIAKDNLEFRAPDLDSATMPIHGSDPIPAPNLEALGSIWQHSPGGASDLE